MRWHTDVFMYNHVIGTARSAKPWKCNAYKRRPSSICSFAQKRGTLQEIGTRSWGRSGVEWRCGGGEEEEWAGYTINNAVSDRWYVQGLLQMEVRGRKKKTRKQNKSDGPSQRELLESGPDDAGKIRRGLANFIPKQKESWIERVTRDKMGKS